jgi:hypothetical protein
MSEVEFTYIKPQVLFCKPNSVCSHIILSDYNKILDHLGELTKPIDAIVDLSSLKFIPPKALLQLAHTMNQTRELANGRIKHTTVILPKWATPIAKTFLKLHTPICPVDILQVD